ncbi:O-antigen ligase family protein [Desulfobacula phenolica]|uniref:O-antigen ligase like membrane protein n=1 Tax=Desulfobacula phenolica TaxID=90732 RepID=A0A1H2EP54_9BACT|nr:O-antigen ligase family protein [Desulfobacula phenolica]SDT96907.1 O-antigen ligase like membrane protein [Desulfobacula phenolica]
MAIKTIFYLITLLGGSVASFFYPVVGLLTYMFVFFTASKHSWWYQEVIDMGVRTSMIPGIVFILSTFIHSQKLNFTRWRISSIEWGLILFLCLVWISPLLGYGMTDYSVYILDKVTKSFVVLFCMMRVVTWIEHYCVIRWMWVLSGLYFGYMAFSGGEDMFLGARLDNIGGGDFSGSSSFAHHLVMTLPFIAGTLLLSKHWASKGLSFVSGVFLINAIIMSRTRGAFLAILFGIVYGFMRAPRKYRKKILVLGMVGLIGAFSLTDPGFWMRMGTIELNITDMEASASGRLELWGGSLKMLSDYPLGVGVGRFQDFIGQYVPDQAGLSPHNTFVRCYSDLGVQGFLVFLFILLMVFKKLKQLRTFGKNNEFMNHYELEAFIIEIALIMGLVAGMFTERLYSEAIWWLVGMTVCLERSAIREQELNTS